MFAGLTGTRIHPKSFKNSCCFIQWVYMQVLLVKPNLPHLSETL